MPKYKVIITVEYEEIVDAGTVDEAARIATDNLPDNDNLSMNVAVTIADPIGHPQKVRG
jgi:hypothetical protein|tara:strand:+ start:59 stop:235 length:177 start_codon:yes stop_codon:yes gene_type:complete